MKEIVGMRPYSFADKETGELIEGYTLFLQWTEDKVNGICCEQCSVKKDRLDGYVPALGDVIRVGYNQYKKVDFVVPVQQQQGA